MSRLTEAEIKRRIAAGAAVRHARLQKREALKADQEKEALLKQKIVQLDDFHKGLKKRLQATVHYLNGVVYREESLSLKKVPEIEDLFEFPNDLDLKLALRCCREEYTALVSYCVYFDRGQPSHLAVAAFNFWDHILSLDGVVPSGSLIINVIVSGNISQRLLEILDKHQEKFKEVGLGVPIEHLCSAHLKTGGIMRLSGESKIWSSGQKEILKKIVRIFQ